MVKYGEFSFVINKFSAILITGGLSSSVGQSVEVFVPSTNTSCQLPSLPAVRRYHTLDGFLLCGGYDAGHSCQQFNTTTGIWAGTGHTLQMKRYSHVSWSVEPEGIILLGGYDGGARSTSEIVKHDGTTESSFHLKNSIL